MTQERTAASWRSSFSDDTLSAMFLELQNGVPAAGVPVIHTRRMGFNFTSRLERAWEMLEKSIDDEHDVDWNDPRAWWYDLAKTISPFAEAHPDTWPQNPRPGWLSIRVDLDIRAHLPLHSGTDPVPLSHCNLCYPEARVRQHVTNGEALACMALCNAYDMHTHAQCNMHLESEEKLRLLHPPVVASAAVEPPVAAPTHSEADARFAKFEASYKEWQQQQELKQAELVAMMNHFIAKAEQTILTSFEFMREEVAKRRLEPTSDGAVQPDGSASKKPAPEKKPTGKGGP